MRWKWILKNQVLPALPSSVGLFNIRATYAGKYMQHLKNFFSTLSILYLRKIDSKLFLVQCLSTFRGTEKFIISKHKYQTKLNQTMECASICKASHILLILKFMIFVSLATIFFTFYFTDVVNKFAERDTTLIYSQETIEKDGKNPPFITLCMTPRSKYSILDEYKLSRGVLDEPSANDTNILIHLNKTIESLFRETTFKINVDFELYIKLWYYDYDHGLKHYEGKMREGSNNYIKVNV